MEENKNIPDSNEATPDKEEIQVQPAMNNEPEAVNISFVGITMPGERIETEKLVTHNPQPVTKDMEVHHHGHVHETKKWKEYLFQFFMLFLAVFCGFLAEYQLEHVIENKREKQFMQSMVNDLALDTALLNEGFPRKETRIKAIDSVFLFFETNPQLNTIPGSAVRNMRMALFDRSYRRNTVTIDQLKNAGGMRLIRKKEVVDSIAAYDQHWERLEFYREAYFTHQQFGSGLIEKILNAYDFLPSYRNNSTGRPSAGFSDSAMFRINTAYLNEFLNFLNRQKAFTIQDKQNYKNLEEQAMRLMELIKKAYHLN